MIRVLQQDNRYVKALFAVIIAATIILMVIFLVPGIFDIGAAGNDPNVYAKIHDPGLWGRFGAGSTEVKTADVERTFQQQIAQNHYPESIARQFLYPRIGQQMVERAVLEHEANSLGLEVSNDDLISSLQHGVLAQYIFPNGKFIGTQAYENFVEQAFQLGVPEFEQEVKSDLEMQRLQSLVTGGVSVSDAAVRANYLQSGTKVQFDYAVISRDDLAKTINPSDADLQAWFKQNSARYANAIPETRKIELFAFNASNMPGAKTSVSDAAIQAYYTAHAADYKVPQEVKTRHILIAVPKGADAKTDAAAKAKAEDVLKQLKAGGNFAALAKKYSDDPGSKDQGGELPMIPTSSLDPAYAQAAMALNPGQTSGLVRSSFGYHIIQTEQKDEAHLKSLAEVKPAIVASLQQADLGTAEQDYANKLAAEAKKDGMQKTAVANNLTLTTTDYIPQSGIIGVLPDSTGVMKAAFAADKGAAPAVASTGEGYAVFQVVDVKAAHSPDFADYKSTILTDYRQDKTPEMLNAALIKLSNRAKVLGDLKKAAAEMNIPVKSSDLVGQDAQVPDLGAMSGPASVAFTLNKGGISGAINEGANGAVLQVQDRQQPTADDIAKNFPVTKAKMLSAKRDEVFQVFAQTLMERYEKAGAISYSNPAPPASPLGQ